ncbi:hypothetical protein TNCT_237541 [Trichonephila clavata]|uniref:Uncharacterized protein n=1 Tax=Trichonephila clavata TaxID=2740835 RepID=A0A8X6FM63_TRICU|nr:hypothetical protein TNCT_237541 [Trichonephila clavata]
MKTVGPLSGGHRRSCPRTRRGWPRFDRRQVNMQQPPFFDALVFGDFFLPLLRQPGCLKRESLETKEVPTVPHNSDSYNCVPHAKDGSCCYPHSDDGSNCFTQKRDSDCVCSTQKQLFDCTTQQRWFQLFHTETVIPIVCVCSTQKRLFDCTTQQRCFRLFQTETIVPTIPPETTVPTVPPRNNSSDCSTQKQ